MTEIFVWQAAAVFWAALCFFRVGAMSKRITMTPRVWLDLAQAALICVTLFGLLSDWRGITRAAGGLGN